MDPSDWGIAGATVPLTWASFCTPFQPPLQRGVLRAQHAAAEVGSLAPFLHPVPSLLCFLGPAAIASLFF